MKKHHHPLWHHLIDAITVSLILITAGGMLLGKNLGYIDTYLFKIVVSWQMLLITLSLNSVIKRHYTTGLVLFCVGGYFLLPYLNTSAGDLSRTYWPILLIFIGVWVLVKSFRKKRKSRNNYSYSREYTLKDGFLKSDVSFGGAEHIVLDPVFRGADIRASFAGVEVDLRRTALEEGETYINLDASFAGIELILPSNWYIVVEAETTLSGIDDTRRTIGAEIDYSRKVVIRGNLNLSGIEIKS